MNNARDLIPWPSLSWFLSHIMRVPTPVHELSPSLKVYFNITSPSDNQMDGIAFIFRQLFGCGTIDTDRIWNTVLGNHLCFVSNFAIKPQGRLNDEMYNDFFQMIPQAIYGFQACIDLTKRNSAVVQLEKYLIAKCRMSNLNDAQKQQFADMFKMPRRIGLLINERVDLLPRSVALEAMKYVLFYAADSNFRRFTHYVMISRMQGMYVGKQSAPIRYRCRNMEEEALKEIADICFEYSFKLCPQHATHDEEDHRCTVTYRRVCLVERSKFHSFFDNLDIIGGRQLLW
ncbi:hypothetical protein T12_3726 [Trichinella patagoniensis]|uniref:Protein BCCIP-like protein n=1 Tax=Trichinella patagoniensis TaxID=990121 RepID=A0A0V1AB40_9BILA|nr:hypothetical protein T12_3726 [Trichinella patagoniensis]